MKILRVATNGVRGLPDRSFDLVDPQTKAPADLVLVTGATGAGKTSFLEAIIAGKEQVAPYGFASAPSDVVRAGEENAKIRIDWRFDENERARAGTPADVATEATFRPLLAAALENEAGIVAVLGTYDPSPTMGKLEYFHAGRRLIEGGSAALMTNRGDVEARLRLTRDDGKYALGEYLSDLYFGFFDRPDTPASDAGIQRFARMFAAVCRTKTFAGVDRTRRGVVAKFKDAASGRHVTSAQLSDGEKQQLLFASTFLRCGLSDSVILVDVPELFLGESGAAALLAGLQTLGSGNQIIAATGLQGLAADAGKALVLRLGDGGHAA
jgi:hypothetical protein